MKCEVDAVVGAVADTGPGDASAAVTTGDRRAAAGAMCAGGRVALGAVALLFAVHAAATTTAFGEVYDSGPVVHRELATGAVASTAGIASNGAFARAATDLSAGTLRASGESYYPLLSGRPLSTRSASYFTEEFWFTSGIGSVAHLDWWVDGSAAVKPPPVTPLFGLAPAAGGEFRVRLDNYDAPGTGRIGFAERFMAPSAQAAAGCQAQSPGSQCVYGDSFSLGGTISFEVVAGRYVLDTYLFAFTGNGGISDFGNTARLYLRTDDGVGIASTSGQLFATAAPVPEPATVALWAIGLGGLWLMRSSRRG